MDFKGHVELFRKVQTHLDNIDSLKPKSWEAESSEQVLGYSQQIRAETEAAIDLVSEPETRVSLQLFFEDAMARIHEFSSLEQAQLRNNHRLFCHYGFLPKEPFLELMDISARVNLEWGKYEEIDSVPERWQMQKQDLQTIIDLRREVAAPVAAALGIKLSEVVLDFWCPTFRNENIDDWVQSLESVKPVLHKHFSGTEMANPNLISGFSFEGVDEEKIRAMFSDIRTAMLEDAGWATEDLERHGVTLRPLVFGPNGYCWGGPKDMHMCVEYVGGDFLRGLGNLIHETGHMIYALERNRAAPEILGTPTAHINGYAMHEVMAMTMEQLAFSPEFWSKMVPVMGRYIPEVVLDSNGQIKKEWSAERLYEVSSAQGTQNTGWGGSELSLMPNMIWRAMAERKMMDEELRLDDLPQFWADTMREWTGVEHDPADFEITESHWFDDNIGYFWGYQWGAMIGSGINMRVVNDDAEPAVKDTSAAFFAAARQDSSGDEISGLTQFFRPYVQYLQKNLCEKLSTEPPLDIAHRMVSSPEVAYKAYIFRLAHHEMREDIAVEQRLLIGRH